MLPLLVISRIIQWCKVSVEATKGISFLLSTRTLRPTFPERSSRDSNASRAAITKTSLRSDSQWCHVILAWSLVSEGSREPERHCNLSSTTLWIVTKNHRISRTKQTATRSTHRISTSTRWRLRAGIPAKVMRKPPQWASKGQLVNKWITNHSMNQKPASCHRC